jgi:hypothetical protein
VFPIDLETPEQLEATLSMIAEARGGLADFDVALHAFPGVEPAPWEAAGATWWLLRFDGGSVVSEVRDVIDSGPPPS